MAEIEIPDEGFDGIHLLLMRGALGIDAFREAYETTGPTIASSRERALLIHEALDASSDVDEIEQILAFAVIPLLTLRHHMEISPAALHSMVEKSERGNTPRWKQGDLAAWQTLKPQIASLLGSEIAMLETKAASLLRARPNTVKSFRLYCDTRPVFDDGRENIRATLITNTLAVKYSTGRDSRTIHFSLDPDDLDGLEKQIAVARRKNDLIRAESSKTGVALLEYTPSDDADFSAEGAQQ